MHTQAQEQNTFGPDYTNDCDISGERKLKSVI